MTEDITNKITEVFIKGREYITIKGVTKVVGFNKSEFILNSFNGPVYLCGEDLELISLNTDEGIIKIEGKIIGYSYMDKKKKESFISKLFKWQ